MTTRRDFVGGAIGSSALSGCGLFEPSWTVRYRLKVRIFADGQTYEGSSVMQTRFIRNMIQTMNDTYRTQAWGEAVIVDCGARGLVFGLLDGVFGAGTHKFGMTNQFDLLRFLPPEVRAGTGVETGEAFSQLKNTRGELDAPGQRRWPVFVRFDDPMDVTTVRLLIGSSPPEHISNAVVTQRFSYALGPGAYVERVTIEMTNAPLTRRIRKELPWILKLQGGHSYHQDMRRPLAANLLQSNFLMDGFSR